MGEKPGDAKISHNYLTVMHNMSVTVEWFCIVADRCKHLVNIKTHKHKNTCTPLHKMKGHQWDRTTKSYSMAPDPLYRHYQVRIT